MKKNRMAVDVAMIVLLPCLMAYSLIGETFHEAAGVANVAWSLDRDTLTILGTGPMYDYADASQVPWASQRESIRVLRMDTRVTSIGAYAFAGCTGLPALTIMDSLSSIGANAFAGCAALQDVYITGIVQYIDPTAFPN